MKRINITLPETTVKLMDRVASKGLRSRLIDQAVKHYLEEQNRQNLKKRLKTGAVARAERDLAIAGEWFAIDEQAWRKGRK
ncbi:MAG: hypothetical protein HY645_12310 [Acidobacteria bacterium]|nr:hypothetical protein [Acidobacteriota bacterium]